MNHSIRPQLLRTSSRNILRGEEPIRLRGVGLGNWLLLEHFMIGLPYVDPGIQEGFAEVLGEEKGAAFFRTWRDTYIREEDIAYLKGLGMNFLRFAFSYRHFERDEAPGEYLEEGFHYTDRLLEWAARHEMYVELDMHAVPGTQAVDWNAENLTGRAAFWLEPHYRERWVALWVAIAERYRGHPWVMGYDLINEPVAPDPRMVAAAYHQAIPAIRAVDPDHIIVLEGNRWGKDPASITTDLLDYGNIVLQPHHYLQQFFPMEEMESYPVTLDGRRVDRDAVHASMLEVLDDERLDCPVQWGEFGLNYLRGGRSVDAGLAMYDDMLDLAAERGDHWTLWHYKDIGAMGFVAPGPDTPWMQFIARDDVEAIGRAVGDLFHPPGLWYRPGGTLLPQLEPYLADVPPELVTRQFREARRDLEKLALHAILAKLRDRSESDLVEMAASFRFDRCRANPRAEALLRKHLA